MAHKPKTIPAPASQLVPAMERPHVGPSGARRTASAQKPTWMESQF